MGINSSCRQEESGPCFTPGRVRQIATLKGRRLDERRYIELRKNNIAFGFVVEKTDAAANRRAVVIEGRIGKTKARREQMLRVVEAARRTGRHSEHLMTVSVRHAAQLIRRYAIASAPHPIKPMASFGLIDSVAVRSKRDSLRWVE